MSQWKEDSDGWWMRGVEHEGGSGFLYVYKNSANRWRYKTPDSPWDYLACPPETTEEEAKALTLALYRMR